IPAAGGTPVAVTQLGSGERFHAHPQFLPDSRHLLYRLPVTSPGETNRIYLASLDSTDRTKLLDSDSLQIFYSQGHLLFLREMTLMAQPFDARRLTLTGEASPVVEQVRVGSLIAFVSVAENGVIAYQTRSGGVRSELVWTDRAGKKIGVLGDPADYADIELSPDGKRVVVSLGDPAKSANRDFWLYDVLRGLRTRLTFDPALNVAPIWSPDGTRIVFSSNRRGNMNLYQKASSGAGSDEAVLKGD